MRTIKAIGCVVSTVLTILLAIILLCNIYTIVVRHATGERQPTVFGWSSAVVISGSMSGTIEINDMILVREHDTYEVGDIVSFDTGNSIVTHRIVSEHEDGFVTQGDANTAADKDPVRQEQIVGCVEIVIPKIGLLIEYLRTPLGMLCVVLLGFCLIQISSLLERAAYQKK